MNVGPNATGEMDPTRHGDVREYPMTCQGEGGIEIYLEPVLAAPRLVLLGHTPVVQSLARLGTELGFEIGRWTGHDGAGIDLHTTPLHNAAWMGNLDMVKLLLELGADPNVRDPTHDSTPLGWAEYNGQTEVARYLRERMQA